MSGGAKLPHLPLWRGVLYRLIRGDGTELPVRMLLPSALPFPRRHIFEHLGTFEEYHVQEHARGRFTLDGEEISIEFA